LRTLSLGQHQIARAGMSRSLRAPMRRPALNACGASLPAAFLYIQARNSQLGLHHIASMESLPRFLQPNSRATTEKK